MSTSAPRLLAGRYELGERLGAGGMAEVFRARDRATGQEVAVKLLSPGLADDPKVLERLAGEARAAAAIDHPNVVAVRDWGDGYIAMEYVPGPNLKELLRQRGPLPEAEALGIAGQVAAGLGAAHARGVVHLDVKPHNVLIAPDGQAKVADFGIARALGGAGATLTTVIGSAPYISPEQARGARVDARSDLYSLGALLFELLTGRPPFEGNAPLEVALRHLNDPPTPPRQLRPELSAAVDTLVLRALAKDPAARFGSAAEMGQAIEQAALGIPADPALAHTQPLVPIDATRPLPLQIPTQPTRSPAGAPVSPIPLPRPGPSLRRFWPAAALVALVGAALVAFAAASPSTAGPTPRPTTTTPAPAQPSATTVPTKPSTTTAPAPTATAPLPTATVAPNRTATAAPPPTATPPPPKPTTPPPPAVAPPADKQPAAKPGGDDDKKPKKPKRGDGGDD
jgi:serine/threonine protein kinase